MVKIRITDDGGPIVGRLALMLPDDPFAVIKLGDLEIAIAGVGDMGAERCRMLAGEFERLRLELLNAGRPMAPREVPALTAGRPRLFVELSIGAAFRFEHDVANGEDLVWTKTGDREYARMRRKRIGSRTAPVLELDETTAAAARAAEPIEAES